MTAQWIDFKLTEPCNNELVDIWSEGERVTDIYFVDGKFGEWSDDATIFYPWEHDVSHWMYRPEPPK